MNKGYAHPEDHVEILAEKFTRLGTYDKYGVDFVDYVRLVEIGEWSRIVDPDIEF